MASKKPTRITMKLKCPNPLFEQWLKEWRDKAKENNSKMQHCFNIALKSLQKYPLPLESGKDCKLLQGFGNKLCEMLDEKLKTYNKQDKAIQNPNEIISKPKNSTDNIAIAERQTEKTKLIRRKSSSNEYIPQLGSGSYAILVTLYEKSLDSNYPGYLTKTEIIKYGKYLSNTSFTKPNPGTRYTAWSSMKTLLNKKLVVKEGNPAKFSLTDSGITEAKNLYLLHVKNKSANNDQELIDLANIESDINSNQSENRLVISKPFSSSSNDNKLLTQKSTESTNFSRQNSSADSVISDETIILAPNTFDILLLVDKQETSGIKTKVDDDALLSELSNLNVIYETRNLKIGDYTWICRDKNSKLELVLPYIIERKRMDDFGSSIKDGRFHEQKFRLKQCGLQNLIYLIESYGNNDEHLGLPLSSLRQAATNTLVQDAFTVKFTDSLRGTAEYLACMTTLLKNNFKSKTVVSCLKEDLPTTSIHDDLVHLMKFTQFNKNASKNKNFKIKEMFVRQFLQIKGMSFEKAFAIVEKYNTPANLKLHYDSIPESSREKLLSTLKYGDMKKNIGPILSKIIFQFFCNETFTFT